MGIQIAVGVIFGVGFFFMQNKLMVFPTALIGSIVAVYSAGMLFRILENYMVVIRKLMAGDPLSSRYYWALGISLICTMLGITCQIKLLSVTNASNLREENSLIKIN